MFAEPLALRLEPVRPKSEPFGLRLFDGLTRPFGDRPWSRFVLVLDGRARVRRTSAQQRR
jgi:hypothetical protein